MSKLKREHVLALLVAIVISIISTYIHHPDTPVPFDILGFKYNDIVYGVLNPRFSPNLSQTNVLRKWYYPERYYTLTRRSRIIVSPYIDYHFEYPLVVGLIWFVSTNLATYLSLPREYDLVTYMERYSSFKNIHYIVHAIVNSASLLAVALLTISIINRANAGGFSKYRFLLYALPSVVIYLVYNWDIICILFLLLSLKYFLDKKVFRAGLFLGLSISTKILTLFTSLVFLIDLIKTKNRSLVEIVYYLTGLFLSGGLPFIVLFMVSPRGFIDFINHHATWYCENCLYQIFIHDIFSPLHRLIASLAIITLVSMVIYLHYVGVLDNILEVSFILVALTISLNYVFSPQMMLLIIPLALITLDTKRLVIYSIADVLNALIILLFFEDELIRMWLSRIGIPVKVEFNPWTITSPVQWIAIFRIALLLTIITLMILDRLRNVKLVVVF